MPDLLSTGVSALLTNQRRLDVTSHNVANANTPGYSRQLAEVSPQKAQYFGVGYIGNGVKIDTIRRRYDQFVSGRVRSSQSEKKRLDTFHKLASSIDNVLADPKAGLSPALHDFYAALQDVSNNPTSIPVRQSLLSRADVLTRRFHTLENHIDSLEKRVNNTVKNSVIDINTLAQSIAKVNHRIVTANGMTNEAPPNDLLDKRDHLIDELSKQVAVSVTEQDDSSYNVFIGNGQALVIGNHASQLHVQQQPFNARRLGVALGQTVVTNQLNGGVLGGALDARRETIDHAQNTLGRVALGLADSVNAQHHNGTDLKGRPGEDFFSIEPPDVRANVSNNGTASVAASLVDPAKLTGKNYILRYDGSAWSALNSDNNASVPLSGSGTASNPFVLAGMKITVGSGVASGDSYLIRPTAAAARTISVEVNDPAAVAAAAPIRTTSSPDNTGGAKISAGAVVDANNPDFLNTATITFTSPSRYSINGSGDYAYHDSEPIIINGTQINLTGSPAVGDTFTVEPNTGGTGDNRNALALSDLQTKGVLNDGTASVGDAYNQLVADIGTQTRRTEANKEAAQALYHHAKNVKESVSGVNLDEEAANMVRFQQGYRAAARMIGVSQTVFDSLINAVR